MSDQLIAPAPAAPDVPPSRGTLRVVLIQTAIVVAVFAAAGALCGLVWEKAWSPAMGEVVKHVWYPISWDRAQPAYFAATGWYVIVGVGAGLVLGGLAAWLCDRAEMATLAAVIVGGLLAGYLMRVVGLHRGPGNPQQIAKTAPDGTLLPSELRLGSWWLITVLPGGALASLGVLFLTVTKRGTRAVAPVENDSELSVPPPDAE